MSADAPQSSALGSPQTNSVSPVEPSTPANHETRPDVPTVEQRVAEFVAEYPDLARLPVSREDGRKLRGEVVREELETVTVVTDEPEEWRRETFQVEEVVERRAATWADALRSFLEWYEGNRAKYGRFARGRPESDDRETFTVPLNNSWQPVYQKEEYAKLQALARETTGGERPSGKETSAAFVDPWIVFLTRSSSSSPNGEQRPPADHDRELVEAWEPVYHTLRNTFRSLGLEASDWEYHRQEEPHTGGGPATCYGHEHTMVIFDAAPMGRRPSREDFEPVIEAHVDACEAAGAEAHRPERSIEVDPVGEDGIADVAGYMAKYVSHAEGDLLERDVEYLAWAANQWATNTQKAVRSDGANQAIRADRCRQAAEDPDRPQVRPHGAEVRRRERRRGGAVIVEHVCACCGSPWGIDQDGTLAAKRLEADGEGPTVIADGGEVVPAPEASEDPGLSEPEEWARVLNSRHEYLHCEECSRLNCQNPREHRVEARPIMEDGRAWASAGETPERAATRRQVERYLEQHPDAAEPAVAGALLLPPEVDWLVREVKTGEDSSSVRGVERAPKWRLEAIVDRTALECNECGHVWDPPEGGHCPKCGGIEVGARVNENPSPGEVDMRPLKLPEQRERRRHQAIVDALGGLKQALYTCECGVTVGPDMVVPHLLDHGLEAEPERAAGFMELAAVRRGGTDDRFTASDLPGFKPHPNAGLPGSLEDRLPTPR